MDLVAGIEISALIFGIVEASKELGVSGKGCRVLALLLGFFFVSLAEAVTQGLIPPDVLPYVEIGVKALAGAISAMGYYDFLKAKIGIPSPA